MATESQLESESVSLSWIEWTFPGVTVCYLQPSGPPLMQCVLKDLLFFFWWLPSTAGVCDWDLCDLCPGQLTSGQKRKNDSYVKGVASISPRRGLFCESGAQSFRNRLAISWKLSEREQPNNQFRSRETLTTWSPPITGFSFFTSHI